MDLKSVMYRARPLFPAEAFLVLGEMHGHAVELDLAVYPRQPAGAYRAGYLIDNHDGTYQALITPAPFERMCPLKVMTVEDYRGLPDLVTGDTLLPAVDLDSGLAWLRVRLAGLGGAEAPGVAAAGDAPEAGAAA